MQNQYLKYIFEEFDMRKLRNAKYSLRAFARDLDLTPSKLSRLLRGKEGISRVKAEALSARLNLSKPETNHFLNLVESEHSRSQTVRARIKEKLAAEQETAFDEISLEKFRVISDWYHFALLELLETEGLKPTVPHLAERLGISQTEAKEAIQRLLDLGLLEKSGSGKWRQTMAQLATPSLPSQVLRKYHHQIIHKLQESLETTPVEERDFSAVTFAVSSSQMELARKELKKFRRSLAEKLKKSADPKDRVYCLSLQYFPIDKRNLKWKIKVKP